MKRLSFFKPSATTERFCKCCKVGAHHRITHHHEPGHVRTMVPAPPRGATLLLQADVVLVHEPRHVKWPVEPFGNTPSQPAPLCVCVFRTQRRTNPGPDHRQGRDPQRGGGVDPVHTATARKQGPRGIMKMVANVLYICFIVIQIIKLMWVNQ